MLKGSTLLTFEDLLQLSLTVMIQLSKKIHNCQGKQINLFTKQEFSFFSDANHMEKEVFPLFTD